MGLDALAAQREGKRTLRTHAVEYRAAPEVDAAELVRLREGLHLSRALFANYRGTNVRTLENWEQGRAKPNAQAARLPLQKIEACRTRRAVTACRIAGSWAVAWNPTPGHGNPVHPLPNALCIARRPVVAAFP